MAYKSPLNNLPVFKTQKFEREYGKPVVAPEVNIPQQRFDFSEVGGATKDTSSDTKVNPARAARQKGRQERRQVRQEARAKRIEKRQNKKTVQAMQRQDKKNIKAGIAQDFQKSLPKPDARKAEKVLNEFVEKNKPKISGEMLTGFVPSSGGDSSITPKTKITGAIGSDLRKKQYDDAGFKYDDTIKGYNRDGSKIEVSVTKGSRKFGPTAMKDEGSPTKMIDPVTGAEMTMQPPMPSNQMGMAKPVFNQTTQDVANQVYGGLDQRQMSMPQPPMFFTDQTGDGKITQADVIKARTEGYEESPNQMSPLNDSHYGDKYKAPELDPDFRNPGGNTNMTKTLTKKPKETTGLRKFTNILTGGLSEAAAEIVQNVKSNPKAKELPSKKITEMPKKRVNGGDLGYVININTGERIPTTTIPQAQNILKKQAQNILKKNK